MARSKAPWRIDVQRQARLAGIRSDVASAFRKLRVQQLILTDSDGRPAQVELHSALAPRRGSSVTTEGGTWEVPSEEVRASLDAHRVDIVVESLRGDKTRIDTYDSASGRLRETTTLLPPDADDPDAAIRETIYWPDGELPTQTKVSHPDADHVAGTLQALAQQAAELREQQAQLLWLHARQQRVNRAASVLDVWTSWMPQRVVNEELGDYLEDINRRALAGQRLRVYFRVLAAMLWMSVNAVGYWRKALGKAKRT